jgi:hypothetical protein
MIPVSLGALGVGAMRSSRRVVFEHYGFGKTRRVGEAWHNGDHQWSTYVDGVGVRMKAHNTLRQALWASGWSLLIPVAAPCGCCEAWIAYDCDHGTQERGR